MIERAVSASNRLAGGVPHLATIVAALVGTGLLRSSHVDTPRLYSGPFGSLLFVAAIGLLAVHVWQRREGRDLFGPSRFAIGLSFAMTVPLLLAVLLEKWLSIELLGRAFDWTDTLVGDPAIADALYRMWTGLGLTGISLALLVILRQSRSRIAALLTPRLLAGGMLLSATAIGLTALLVAGVALLIGPMRLGILDVTAPVLGTTIAAQVVRSAAEELYYRGLLQTTLRRLVVQAGVPGERPAQLFAIVAVSLGFAVEHVDFASAPRVAVGSLAYVFAMSCALGALLELSRNLYLPMIAHAAMNLVVGLLIPLPMAGDMSPLLPPDIIVMWFVVLLFTGLALFHRVGSFGWLDRDP